MAKLFIFNVLCVFPALVSARPFVTNFIVQGRVYCDTCRAGFETSATTYIQGARVRVECRDRSGGQMTYSAEGMTDPRGTYKIAAADDREYEICEVALVSSPQGGCTSAVPGRERTRVVLARNNGIVSDTRYANNLGFQKDTPLPGCSQLLKQYEEPDV